MPPRPPPRRNPRQTRSRLTVDAILGAATRVFTERGYARASTNLIAETAGVSVGSLYQYFPDKLALLAALHERHLATLMTAMATACRGHSGLGLAPALQATITAAAQHHRVDAPLLRLFARHLPRDQKPAQPHTAALQTALRELLKTNRSELRIADHELALFVLRNFGRSLMQAAAEHRPRDLENGTIARELLATAMNFLTGATPRPARGKTPARPPRTRLPA